MGDLIEEIRDENLKNVEVGIDGSTHTYYINGVPYQSENVKQRYFGGYKTLRERPIEDNMNEEETGLKDQMARMVEVVYDRRKAYSRPISVGALRGVGDETDEFETELEERKLYAVIPNQNVGDFIFEETGNDLTGLFVNNNTNQSVLAIRGLLPVKDSRDSFQLGSMMRSMVMEADRAEGFGKEYRNDRNLIQRDYLRAVEKYPGHKITVTGHSRGGRSAIFLGRKYNIDYHAFSPVGNRADFVDSTPRDKGRLYYHTKDPVSFHFHKFKGKTEETHYEGFNNRLYTHSLKDFYDGKTAFVKHQPRIVDENINKETMEEVFIDAEDLVDSDLGNFGSLNMDFILVEKEKKSINVPTTKPTITKFIPSKALVPYIGIGRQDERPVFKSQPIYFDSLDIEKKNTIALNKDVPSERTIFNEYMPSVFTDINLKPAKKFKPMTFEEIDSDKNDKISLKELNDYLSKRGYDEQTIKNLFETYDTDNNGNISRTEFTDLKQMV